MQTRTNVTAAAALMLAAGAAMAQPVIDGTRDASYGQPLWIQNLPTSFGDNVSSGGPCNPVGGGITIALNNSNVAGVTGGAADGADLVTTGVEIRIPLVTIGINAQDAANIKFTAFINGQGHDFLSNQVTGSSSKVPFGNLAEPRNVNFDDTADGLAGSQYLTVSDTACTADFGPVMDGTADSFYGDPIFAQTNPTGFGDASSGQVDFTNGSELDNVRARICTIDTDGPGPILPQRYLVLFLAGNLESNYNKLDIFFDTRAGGQQRLRGDNPNIDFNGLNRMGDDGSGNGLRFDADFAADYFLSLTCGGGDCSGGTFSTFSNFAELHAEGGGDGTYLGCGGATTTVLNSNPTCPDGIPSPDFAVGSEIDAVYGQIVDNRLYVMVAGNLESNYNKLELFFDVASGGQNTLRNNNQDVDFNGLNRLGQGPIPDPNDPDCATDPFNNPDCNLIGAPGLTFDAGFEADYYINVTTGGGQGGLNMYGNAAHIRTDGIRTGFLAEPLDFGSYSGGLKSKNNPVDFDGTTCVRTDPEDGSCIAYIDEQGDPFGEPPEGILDILQASVAPRIISDFPYDPIPHAIPGLIVLTIDNNNVGGVTGKAASASAAAAVTTGIEVSVDLTELGWDGKSPIRVAGWIANSGHDVVSNQIIATDGLPKGSGNLNEPRLLDFNSFAGLQYVVVPQGGGPVCPCDFNSDEILNSQDFFDFLSCFFTSGCEAGDYNEDNVVNSQDFFDFLSCFFAPPTGC